MIVFICSCTCGALAAHFLSVLPPFCPAYPLLSHLPPALRYASSTHLPEQDTPTSDTGSLPRPRQDAALRSTFLIIQPSILPALRVHVTVALPRTFTYYSIPFKYVELEPKYYIVTPAYRSLPCVLDPSSFVRFLCDECHIWSLVLSILAWHNVLRPSSF